MNCKIWVAHPQRLIVVNVYHMIAAALHISKEHIRGSWVVCIVRCAAIREPSPQEALSSHVVSAIMENDSSVLVPSALLASKF